LLWKEQEQGMNTSEILGKQVLDKSGNNVGKVVDIGINFPQWTVNHLTVRIGIIKKIPVGIDKIEKIGDKIILNNTKDDLEKAA
jgi:sporulation protein YlmC with PRC-barrel domain